jgi:NitT/TauT family transport system ATP-binding protein
MSLLEVESLSKSFDATVGGARRLDVLSDVSFRVEEGEFVSIVGPSGSGKSTLLNILAHVDKPTGGVIRFRDREILSARTSRLQPGWQCQIGYVPQTDDLLPWRRLEDNVLFPLRAQGRDDPESRKNAARLIDAAGLAGFEKHYPHELSGGMRKRVALVRTLVYDPPIILMDEPFGALDASTRSTLHEDLLRLWSEKRKTIIFVTHDIVEAITLADRVLVLSRVPTKIIGEHVVELPRPRSARRVVTRAEFVQVYEAILAQLG